MYRLLKFSLGLLALLLAGCSSVELAPGPSVEDIYYQSASGSSEAQHRVNLLREQLIPNPRFDISDPMMPIIKPGLSFPVYVRGKRTRYYQEEGRFVHEIVDPGGYIN